MAKRKAKKKGEGLLGTVGSWFSELVGGGASKPKKKAAKKPAKKQATPEAAAHLHEIFGLLMLGAAVWLLTSMLTYYTPFSDAAANGRNWGGQLGFYLANYVFIIFGWSGYMVCFLMCAWGFVIVTQKELSLPVLRVFGGLCFLVSSSYLFQLGFGSSPDTGSVAGVVSSTTPYGPGGYFALYSIDFLVTKLGGPGMWLIMGLVSLVSFMLATEMAFFPALGSMRDWFVEQNEKRDKGAVAAVIDWISALFVGIWGFLRGSDIEEEAKPKKKAAKKPAQKKPVVVAEEDDEEEDEDEEEEEEWEYVYEDVEEEDEDEEDEEEEEDEEDEAVVTPAPRRKPVVRATSQQQLPLEPVTPPAGPWRLPPLDMLTESKGGSSTSEKELEDSAMKLENALASFKVEAHVVGARVGPAITLFELEVAQGTRMNKVTALSQEIAGALLAKSVRIIAPIPGRATIGIEIPNKSRAIVTLHELVRQEAYDMKKYALPLFLGMDAEGEPIIGDLAKMPHLLIAGTTGSGKSVCINTILASMLLTRSPHEVQWILIDPKMVELQMFTKVPH
ncbi:MAG: S-DNA-T family DNA segregation ATPase FtsK/SpoIIIE, partial [Planctomycetota bacterium]